eukprot:357141-Chlamydomonas_euryale.AAC.1
MRPYSHAANHAAARPCGHAAMWPTMRPRGHVTMQPCGQPCGRAAMRPTARPCAQLQGRAHGPQTVGSAARQLNPDPSHPVGRAGPGGTSSARPRGGCVGAQGAGVQFFRLPAAAPNRDARKRQGPGGGLDGG